MSDHVDQTSSEKGTPCSWFHRDNLIKVNIYEKVNKNSNIIT